MIDAAERNTGKDFGKPTDSAAGAHWAGGRTGGRPPPRSTQEEQARGSERHELTMEGEEILNPGRPTADVAYSYLGGGSEPGVVTMEGEEILNPDRPTADVVYFYPGGGGVSRTTAEAHDDGVVLVLGPGASSASTDGPVAYPDVVNELLITSARPPATRSDVTYTDWTTAHGAHLPSGASVAPSQSVVGAYAYPEVVMAMEHSGYSPAPATRSSVPSAGSVIGESYTDMLMAHLDSDMPPAAWNNVAYPYPGSATATPSSAIIGVASTAYPGGLNLNAVTAGPETNAVGFGYAIDVYQGMADLGSERLHPTGTAVAAAATEPRGGYYNDNSGMALPLAAQVVDEAEMESLVAHAAASQDEVPGAVAEPVRGRLGELGLAATSVAMAGLITGGVDTPVTAIVLFGMLIAGVILVTVRVFRA